MITLYVITARSKRANSPSPFFRRQWQKIPRCRESRLAPVVSGCQGFGKAVPPGFPLNAETPDWPWLNERKARVREAKRDVAAQFVRGAPCRKLSRLPPRLKKRRRLRRKRVFRPERRTWSRTWRLSRLRARVLAASDKNTDVFSFFLSFFLSSERRCATPNEHRPLSSDSDIRYLM
jgi:hypothetical protein